MEKEEEIWKEIPGYPSYRVSNLGRVKKIAIACHRGQGLVAKLGILKPFENRGYWRVYLANEHGGKKFLVHRLVAAAFLPNPNNYPEINHKDENRKNNVVKIKNGEIVESNIEWCTPLYNNNYGNRKKRASSSMMGKNTIKVDCFDKDFNFIKTYNSTREAASETNCSEPNISKCCAGERCYAGGYRWRYTEKSKQTPFKKPSNIRGIEQLTKTGDLIRSFKSIKEASRTLGITYTNITECLRGVSKTAGGYKWRYTC